MGVCENLVDTCKIQEKFMAQHYLMLGESPEGLFWSGFPRPPPGNLLHPGIEPASFTSLALAGRVLFVCLFCVLTTSTPWETQAHISQRKSKPVNSSSL